MLPVATDQKENKGFWVTISALSWALDTDTINISEDYHGEWYF